MATCSFGTSGIKILNLNFNASSTSRNSARLVTLQQRGHVTNNVHNKLVLSQRSGKGLIEWCQCLSSNTQDSVHSEDNSEEVESSRPVSPQIPNSFEVQSLLTALCDTTSIAEFELKLNGFRLYVMRDLTGVSNSSPPPISAPVMSTTVEATELNGSALSPSVAITKADSTSGVAHRFLDKAADEGLVIVQSPRVGFFRRSRTIKGKRAPPSCKEKQIVKEGQVLCYIEQLGCELPVESDVSGEVVKILKEDGDSVGYGDPVAAILPSFPGIKKLQ